MNLRAVSLPATVTMVILACGFGFSWAANWPGHLSYDSVIQLLEGRTAIYANWHPPVMSWMLGLADAALPGAGLFVLFDTLLVFGAFWALATLKPTRLWLAPVVAAALVTTPQLLIYPAIVWKDVLFAAASVAGFVCLALAAARWQRSLLRLASIAAGLALLVLAALARQNGIVMVLFGAATLAWIAGRKQGWRAGAAYGAASLAAALVVGSASYAALHSRVRGDLGPGAQIRLLQSYDLIGALHADPALKLEGLAHADPGLEQIMRVDGVRLYSPQRNDTLTRSPDLVDAINGAPPPVVAAAWWGLVRDHPLLYLQTRWAAFDWVFLTPDLSVCVPYYFGIDGPAATMKALGYTRRWDGRDQALDDYAGHFLGSPILSHVFWAAVAVFVFIVLLRRRRPADLAIAGLQAAALSFTASFFVISIACDYRYLYALDLAAMAGAFYLLLDPSTARPRDGA